MLKCLQVTSLKVAVQGWGCETRKRKIPGKESVARRWRKMSKPTRFKNRGMKRALELHNGKTRDFLEVTQIRRQHRKAE
jgi:hypothetical protein